MWLRTTIAIAVLAGCRGDGRGTDRAQTHAPAGAPTPGSGPQAGAADPGGAGAAGPGGATAAGAGAAGAEAAGAGGGGAGAAGGPAGGAAPARVGPPPGTDKLVPVPAEIAAKVDLREVVRGLDRPVLLTFAPGDPRKRLFILEQHVGRIRILENGKLLPKPFFQIGGLSQGNEQGLLGLAFHPRFAENGRLFVNYTAEDKDSHIVEYKVSATDPDAVDPATRREIIEIDQPYSNHNGGGILFGPDGKLYAGMGDGGSAGDPKRAGQDPKQLLAKMLRFDVEAAAPVPEILHMGLRNPWRFWFDAKDGALYIGDVGQNLWEYVFAVPGTDAIRRNFGWNIVEGNHCYNARTCNRAGFTPPVAEYSHDEGCSITGGVTYRGKALPMLDGRYFYGDYCTGLLRSFVWTRDPSSPTAPGWIREHWDWKAAIDRRAQLTQISSFGVDHDGELYIVKLTGEILRLVPRG
jgi:glucose/arabinose dehydrogenase